MKKKQRFLFCSSISKTASCRFHDIINNDDTDNDDTGSPGDLSIRYCTRTNNLVI